MHKIPFPKTATFLSDATNEHGNDPPIPPERAAEVWHDFEPVARMVVLQTLWKLPLSRLRDQLQAAGVPLRRGLQGSRRHLAMDNELLADLVQDVALALVLAIRRGKVRSARPLVYSWVRVTAARITREKSRADATVLLAGAHLSAKERAASDDLCVPERGVPTACVVGRPLDDGDGPEHIYGVRTALRELLFAAVPANLTSAQELVFTRWVEGASHEEVAKELGISTGAVRLRLLHARRRLAS